MKKTPAPLARAISVAAIMASSPLWAANITWDGDTSVAFATAGNWAGGIAPTTADVAIFSTPGVAFQPTISATGTLAGLQVDTATTFTLTTFNNALSITGPLTGAAAITVAGYVPGSTNPGVLTFSNTANTFSGGLTITGGTVRYNSGTTANTAFGTQAITLNGGTFSYQGPEINVNAITGAPVISTDRSFLNGIVVGSAGGRLDMNQGSGANNAAIVYGDISLGGALTFGSASGGNSHGVTFGGTITLDQSSSGIRRLTSVTSHNGNDYISGAIMDGSGGAGNALRITSQGRTLVISGNGNTYSGGTIVEAAGNGIVNSFVRVYGQTSLGTGGLTVESGGRIQFSGLQALGLVGGLSGSATVNVAEGGAVGNGRAGISVTADRTSGSDVLTNVVSTRDLVVGESITGTGIPANTTVAEILSDTSVRISQVASTSGTGATYTAAGIGIDATSRFSATSAGIYAIENTHTYDINQATVGNGRMFLGQGPSGGVYSGILGAGAGATYRVGGGLPTAATSSPLAYGVLSLPTAGTLSGANNLIVGPGVNARTNLSRVVISADQTFSGNGSGSAIVINNGSELYTARDGGTPFGAATNAIEVFGTIGASGATGSMVGTSYPLTFRAGSGIFLSQSNFTNGDGPYTGTSGQGRWGDTIAIALNGTTLTLDRGRNVASQGVEDVGAISFNARSAVNFANNTTTGFRYDLQADSLARTGRGVLIIAKTGVLGGTGTNDSQFKVDGLAGNTNGMLTLAGAAAPYVQDGTGNTFVRNGANGLEDVVYDFTGATALTSGTATSLVDQSGAITLSGPVSVFALRMSNAAITGSATNTVTVTSGGAILQGGTHTAKFLFQDAGGAPVEAVIRATGATSMSGSIVAQAGLTKTGTNILNLSGAANDIAGGINIWEGTLQPTSTGNVADFSDNIVTVGHAGNFNLNARSVTIAGLAGEGAAGVVQNSASATDSTLTVDIASGSQTYEGTLSENATNPQGFSFTKAGAGTQILTGLGTYTGATTVTAGALVVHGSLSGSGPVNVSGGTLGGGGTIAGPVTVSDGAFLAPSGIGSDSTDDLSISNSLTLSNASTLTLGIAGTAGGTFDRLTGITAFTLDGTIALTAADGFATTLLTAGTSFDLLDWSAALTNNGFTFDFAGAPLGPGLVWDTSSFSTNGTVLVAVPEPGSAVLLIGGLASLASRRRKSS